MIYILSEKWRQYKNKLSFLVLIIYLTKCLFFYLLRKVMFSLKNFNIFHEPLDKLQKLRHWFVVFVSRSHLSLLLHLDYQLLNTPDAWIFNFWKFKNLFNKSYIIIHVLLNNNKIPQRQAFHQEKLHRLMVQVLLRMKWEGNLPH